MRVIAHNVEYFDLMRDQGTLMSSPHQSLPESPSDESSLVINGVHADRGLRDSLWYFDGTDVQCWMDVEDLVLSGSKQNERDLPVPVSIATDFYPSSVLLDRGVILGLDADLIQRRDIYFAFFRQTSRVSSAISGAQIWIANASRRNCFYPIFSVNTYCALI